MESPSDGLVRVYKDGLSWDKNNSRDKYFHSFSVTPFRSSTGGLPYGQRRRDGTVGFLPGWEHWAYLLQSNRCQITVRFLTGTYLHQKKSTSLLGPDTTKDIRSGKGKQHSVTPFNGLREDEEKEGTPTSQTWYLSQSRRVGTEREKSLEK